ncbi:T9SS type A sorting domain-containing protein [Hwangdonia lutea]|uniref:T9SS type A sorting domain-containing protein n=1 Tax=Hwangdonia lutea TaxID=3075823 RepID=A0AA97EMV2_9FLAO|nr:T9SS type A sorting domain-containing protein [Hwangdonia sp. SCSIO 19198]WOD44309.1 T9SS type A sorting domain-containing protein [Hwangdonia sp. SCSIO 19198]
MKKIYIACLSLFLTLSTFAQVTDVATGLNSPNCLAVKGDYLYIAELNGNKISKIDLTISNPTPITVITGVNAPRGLVFNGDELYISENSENKISKINVTDVTPTKTDLITGITNPGRMVLHGNALYIAEDPNAPPVNNKKIYKVDVSQPTPTLSTFVTGVRTAKDLWITGNYMYIAVYQGNKISKVDITAATPVLTDEITGMPAPIGLALDGNDLYISHYTAAGGGGNKISKIDITVMPQTTATTVIPSISNPADILLVGSDMYIAQLSLNKISKFSLNALSVSASVFEELSVFPNPSLQYLQISGLTRTENYKIYNTLGVEVAKGNLVPNHKITISQLKSGLYFLEIANNNTFKFVKK